MMDVRKGDGVITHSGGQGIVTSNIFRTVSGFDRDAVRVAFEVDGLGTLEMAIELGWIQEVWRSGVKLEAVEQLPLL